MAEEVTFKVFKIGNFNKRKYEDITLKLNSVKYVHCSGSGCEVKYKNGREKYLWWHSEAEEKTIRGCFSTLEFKDLI